MIFCMKAKLLKRKFTLMPIPFYWNDHLTISLPNPLPFESVLLGVCGFETQLWQNKAWESVLLITDLLV